MWNCRMTIQFCSLRLCQRTAGSRAEWAVGLQNRHQHSKLGHSMGRIGNLGKWWMNCGGLEKNDDENDEHGLWQWIVPPAKWWKWWLPNCSSNQRCQWEIPYKWMLIRGLEHEWFIIFQSVGNSIIPTDEVHHFSQGYTTNQQWMDVRSETVWKAVPCRGDFPGFPGMKPWWFVRVAYVVQELHGLFHPLFYDLEVLQFYQL